MFAQSLKRFKLHEIIFWTFLHLSFSYLGYLWLVEKLRTAKGYDMRSCSLGGSWWVFNRSVPSARHDVAVGLLQSCVWLQFWAIFDQLLQRGLLTLTYYKFQTCIFHCYICLPFFPHRQFFQHDADTVGMSKLISVSKTSIVNFARARRSFEQFCKVWLKSIAATAT